MKQRNEKGIAHLGVIIAAIVVVAAVAFGGWYVWQKNRDDKNGNGSNNSQNNQNEEPSDPSEGGKYLVISEWSVRFELPEELRGDIYYETFTNSIGETGAVFASKKLDALVGDGSCTFLKRPDGTKGEGNLSAVLSRLDPNNPGESSLEYYRSQRTLLVTVGQFEYYSVNPAKDPPITCVSEERPELNDEEVDISSKLKEAFAKIEATE